MSWNDKLRWGFKIFQEFLIAVESAWSVTLRDRDESGRRNASACKISTTSIVFSVRTSAYSWILAISDLAILGTSRGKGL